jgi:hypothetical protein
MNFAGGAGMTNAANEPGPTSAGGGPELFFQAGKERAEALLDMQKELFVTYQEVCRNWQMRAKSEIDTWSQFAKELTEAHSFPEGLQAYRHCLSQRMQLAADDGKRLLDDAQKVVGAVTRSYTPKKPAKAA